MGRDPQVRQVWRNLDETIGRAIAVQVVKWRHGVMSDGIAIQHPVDGPAAGVHDEYIELHLIICIQPLKMVFTNSSGQSTKQHARLS